MQLCGCGSIIHTVIHTPHTLCTGNKLASFNKAVAGGFGLAAVLCGSIMAAGYLTFGAASSGFILNNYVRPLFHVQGMGRRRRREGIYRAVCRWGPGGGREE